MIVRAALTAEQAATVADFRHWTAFEAERRRAMLASGVPEEEASAWAAQEAAARERIAGEVGREVAARAAVSITLAADGTWLDWRILGGSE